MDEPDQERLTAEMLEVVERLRAQRPAASPLELDRIKLRAMAQARRRTWPFVFGKGRARTTGSRVVAVILTVGALGGGGVVFAAAGGFHGSDGSRSAAQSQYCPPTSQQPGKPKPPPAKPGGCGNPKTKTRSVPTQSEGPGLGHGRKP